MEEWEEFKFDDVPGDILTVDYEFKWDHGDGKIYNIFKLAGDRESVEKRLYTIWSHRFIDLSVLYYRKPEPEQPTHEVLEYIFKPGDVVKSIPTGKIYTVEETVHEGMKVYLLPREQSDERLYNFAHELTLVQPQPGMPTHEEIWNNSWYEKYLRVWCRVIGYRNGNYTLYNHKHMQNENHKPVIVRSKEWFIGKRSALVPPEAE